ncbi:reverse transcriptase (rna-dependent dna polymerase) [Holotrichia oblita]|uniref:Reverse transcriptase (Rna-dependent dna polymerase) n=1 Tax=Holotrichia oblita TaxID=644536 RepID=A0ACB9TE56_HOLOL|nr:reverse transcriptase (rna-dependent dna polymerase) [Holotrichia oblita]
MIHKGGDKLDPANYRGISLINTVTKIFTTILHNRLSEWCEQYIILPEEQSGFRHNRGCIDNIYILISVVGLNIMPKSSYLYAIFVDFKKAFDSIDHRKLWLKLYKIGVSGKNVRILKALYDNIRIMVPGYEQTPEFVDIAAGVLQGDSLSPLLFSIFIADIVEYFVRHGMEGVKITSRKSIVMLLYANDIVLFARSPIDGNKKLEILHKYCVENSLDLNTDKNESSLVHQSLEQD